MKDRRELGAEMRINILLLRQKLRVVIPDVSIVLFYYMKPEAILSYEYVGSFRFQKE